MFESRFITKDDYSIDRISLGNDKYWDFAELQKAKSRTWHSRPYEYAFVVQDMLRAYLLDMISLDKVLDLACGINHPGYMAIAELYDVKTVVALDMNKALLHNGMDHSKVHKIIGNATKTEFNNDTFDAISCVSALEHMPNWKAVIREMSRILKPRGMAFITIDISVDSIKTAKHGVDDKTPADYANEFERVGLYIAGKYDDHLPEDAVDTICSKYPLSENESELLRGQHNALKTFRMVLKKG